MRSPLFSQVEAPPDAKSSVSSSARVRMSRAYTLIDGASDSPSRAITIISTTPAAPTDPARRASETPLERITTSSRCTARFPRPTSAPISAAAGSNLTTSRGIRSTTKAMASRIVY